MFSFTKKAPIEIAEDNPAQQESALHARKTLKPIYNQAVEKENLTIRQSLKPVEHEAKKKKMASKSVQTAESSQLTVTEEDLTGETASDNYWRILAETRAAELDNSFRENEKLKDEVDHLKRENYACQEMLQESRDMIELLEEMLETPAEDANAEAAPDAEA